MLVSYAGGDDCFAVVAVAGDDADAVAAVAECATALVDLEVPIARGADLTAVAATGSGDDSGIGELAAGAVVGAVAESDWVARVRVAGLAALTTIGSGGDDLIDVVAGAELVAEAEGGLELTGWEARAPDANLAGVAGATAIGSGVGSMIDAAGCPGEAGVVVSGTGSPWLVAWLDEVVDSK